jgi:imidazolonepropionase-like amidohydrolase
MILAHLALALVPAPLAHALVPAPQQAPAAAASNPPAAIAFVDVEVVPMDKERVLSGQTVVVQGDRIVALGPVKDVAIPKGAIEIRGREGEAKRWLMPGLADMHVHAWSPDDMALFVINGVTTVRNMSGTPMHIGWKSKVASGELFGPACYSAGPIIDGDPPVWPGSTVLKDPAEAEKVVLEQKGAGYDFLKVYARLPKPSYEALVEAARKHEMRVMGHVPGAVGLERVLEVRQDSVEHLDGLAAYAQTDESPFKAQGIGLRQQDEPNAWGFVDDAKIARYGKIAAEKGVWTCPTVVVFQKMAHGAALDALRARPEMQYVPAFERTFWKNMPPREEFFTEAVEASIGDRFRAIGLVHKAGGRILLGTDMGNPCVLAGYAAHEELSNLVAGGLSPFEALRAGTSGAAEFMKGSREWGTVAVGLRADLVLLEANPLDDVKNAARRVGVMSYGRWHPAEELRTRLTGLAAKNGDPPAKDAAAPK